MKHCVKDTGGLAQGGVQLLVVGCILEGDVEGRQAGGVEVDRRQTRKWRGGPVLSVGSHRFMYVLGDTNMELQGPSLSVSNVIFSTYPLICDCT